MTESPVFEAISELGRRLRKGEVTAASLADLFLDRLKRLGPDYNAVVRVTDGLAREQAAQADRELRDGRDRGPLHGIPFGVKICCRRREFRRRGARRQQKTR